MKSQDTTKTIPKSQPLVSTINLQVGEYSGVGISSYAAKLIILLSLVLIHCVLIGQPVLLKSNAVTPTQVGSIVYFFYSTTGGFELWKTDGTAGGTAIVKSLAGLGTPYNSGNFNEQLLYFRLGNNLWRSDGTDAGTMPLADVPLLFNYPPSNFGIEYLGSTTTKFFFRVTNGAGGTLGYSDGTAAGTVNTNQPVSPPPNIIGGGKNSIGIGDKLYFVYTLGYSNKLYVTNGSTFLQLRDFPTFGPSGSNWYVGKFNEYNGKLIFAAYSGIHTIGDDVKLWTTDGTIANTNFLINPVSLANPGPIISHGPNLNYSVANKVGNKIFFDRAVESLGQEPYVYDGVNVSLVKDIAPGNASSGMSDFFDGGSNAYTFRADLTGNLELWKSDGTDNGTSLVKNLSIFPNPNGLSYTYIIYGKAFNNSLVFIKDQSRCGDGGLWRSDGTDVGTGRIALGSGSDFFVIGNNIVYSYNGLYAIDGQSKFYQEITFSQPNSKAYGSPDFDLTGTVSSNLPLAYASSNTNVATINGNTVTIVGAGSTTITASQGGDATFAAAIPVQRTFSVTKASQTITFGALPAKNFGDPAFGLTATASSGLNVTYTSSNTSVATISGSTVTIVGAGSTTITAAQAGNANFFAASSIQQGLSVNKANQTITFSTFLPMVFGDPSFGLSATSSAGLNVTYSSSNTSVATISGSTVTIAGAGSTTITAAQTGNANFFAATSVQQTLTINKANQTITFGAIPIKSTIDPQFNPGATSTSGLAVSYASSNTSVATVSGSTINIIGAGTSTITASQVGNGNYNSATQALQTLVVQLPVVKSNQTITFDPLSSKTFNNVPSLLTGTASSALPVTYVSSNTTIASINGSVLTIEGAGTCTITAKQVGDANFNAATDVQQSFTVNKAGQSLTANFLSTPRFTTDGPFNPQAFYNSGLPATITSSNTAVATVSGNIITPVSAGVTTLTVSQPGGNNFLAAANSTFSLTISNPSLSPYKFTGQGGAPVAQLSFPLSNLEVDASGKIYAINPSLSQIVILNADGSFNKVFGKFGTNDGELINPSDVAIDGAGNIYVVDAGNHRIQVFDSNGSYIRKFGSIGAASGKLLTPNSIALDGNGNAFITERSTGRVSVISLAGIFQYSFGTSGSGTGQLSIPRGIDLDNSGNAYVVDAGNGRVVVYSSNGTYLRTIGTNGSGNGQLNGPKYVKLDAAGNVVVTNDFNARVEVFDNNGNFLANFPWPGGSTGVCGIARDGSGNFYISNYNTNELLKFNSSGSLVQTIMPLPQTALQVFQPTGVAFDVPGNVYVSSASKDVRVFTSSGSYIRTIGAPGTADGQFKSSPGKIAVDASGNTYVADTGNSRVQVFSNTGTFIRKVGVGLLGTPVGLAIDGSGNIYVSDQLNHNIQVFQNNGTFIASFGSSGGGNGQFSSPSGVAVDGSGNIYVADGGNNRVQVFNSSGTFIRAFGTPGSGNGQFNLPFDIKLDGAGNIYVADRNNHRVQVFKNDGSFLYTAGSLGYGSAAGNGHVWLPTSLAVNASGLTIGVADFNNNLIQAFGSPDVNLKQSGSIATNGNYNFGNVNMLSSSSATTFTIENLGSAALTLTGNPKVTVSGTNAADFVLNVTATTSTIAPASNTTFTVMFTPSASGVRTAQLSISSDDLDETPYLINLSGTGVKINQTITFNSLAAKTFSDPAFNLTATAGSSLAVTYASSNLSVATVSGNSVTIVGVGNTTITASQIGNGNYNAAADVPQTLTVNKASQIITFNTLAAKAFDDPDFTLTGSASSGLVVSYTSSDPLVATIAGNTVTITGTGSTTITASQSGNSNFNSATDVPQVFTVNKANQTISFNGLPSVAVGDLPFTLNASSSSGLPVSYSSSNSSVATVSGNTVTIVSLGVTTITASQAGNTNYNVAVSVDQNLSVKQGQTISFAALSVKTFGDAPFSVTASSSSSLSVSFASSNAAVATISGNTVTIVGTGTADITASQPGDVNYNAAVDVQQTLTVDKASQAIAFGSIADKTLGDAAFNLDGTSSSGLSVSYGTLSDKITIAGSQVTLVKAGRLTITASQPGDANFNAATGVDQSFCINPAKPTVAANNSNPEAPVLTSSSTSGNQWYLNGAAIAGETNAAVTVDAAGIYTVIVTVDDCVSEVSATQTFIVTGDFGSLANATPLSVYPNPASTEIKITWSTPEVIAVKEIILYDLLGRQLEVRRMDGDEISIDVSKLSTGNYILKGRQGGAIQNKRFIKE